MTRNAFSVAIFARCHGQILLIKHHRLNLWLPVGGEMEPGETPLIAAKRELFEETGLRGEFTALHGVAGTPPGYLAYEEHAAGDKGLHMNFAFVAEVDSDAVQNNHEFTSFQWIRVAPSEGCPDNVRQLVKLALSPAVPTLCKLAERWLAAFNGRRLLELLALYADDAVHTSPKLRLRDPLSDGKIVGKAALQAWWAESMQRLPALHYAPLHITARDNRVIMEYERQNPGEPSYVVAEVLVIGDDGRICSSHVFHG